MKARWPKTTSEGLILVRPLVAQLKLFEKDGPAMQYYFPDIVKNLDVDAEKQRLQNVKFATAESAKPKADEKAAAPAESSLDHDLAEGDRQIALKNGTAAEAIFTAVLGESSGFAAGGVRAGDRLDPAGKGRSGSRAVRESGGEREARHDG